MPVVTDGTTNINAIGLGFTLLMCLLMLALPRRYALFPVIALICYMTQGQRIMFAGGNFTMNRIVMLVGWIRIVLRGEIRSLRMNAIDKAMIVWILCKILFHNLLWQWDHQEFINHLGQAYDAMGLYFLFRCLFRGLDDIKQTVQILAILTVPLAACMLAEKLTGRNFFAIFGGVMEFTRLRDGVLRCQGPFAHPILAGTIGATLLPLFVGLWWQGKRNHLLAGFAIVSAVIITFSSASSGPAVALVFGIVALVMWSWRRWLRKIRWGILLGIISLNFVMKAPVWYLMAKMDIFGGSTGAHRAWLIDTAMKHLSEWWLLGIKDPGVWDPLLRDVTNGYLAEGFNAGVATMLLWIFIMVQCFRGVGIAVRRMAGTESLAARRFIWAMGATLFAHVMNYLSISYFDQNGTLYYLELAMISTATAPYLLARRRPSVSIGERPAFAQADRSTVPV